ncbi:MAG: peptidoglycan-binding protein [Bacteroidetes bacterium]|nr:peptidoglycan-binding protein [Bacteroidota bacterium]MCL1968779.1 peptidoglycan-binding protein [Bacteroidota bacterium]
MNTIKKGDTGDDVKQLQEYLKKLGFNISVDKKFGPITDSFVREFQKKYNLTVDGVVDPNTWTALQKEVAKLNETKIIFDNALSTDKQSIVNSKNIEIFKAAGAASKNMQIVITSTIRTSKEQATAMYENEKAGNHISYANPGQQVIQIYNANKTKNKEEVVSLMVKKIDELTEKGLLVSKHCVTKQMYANKNIIDVSHTRLPNPRDFVNALLKYNEVSKIITPLDLLPSSTYNNDKRVSIDKNEPAIHIEM